MFLTGMSVTSGPRAIFYLIKICSFIGAILKKCNLHFVQAIVFRVMTKKKE